MFHCSRTLVRQWFNEALDALSEIFLKAGLLRENRPDRRQRQVMRRKQPVDVVGERRKPVASVRPAPATESPGSPDEEEAPQRESRRA
jgi:hypothetical protein